MSNEGAGKGRAWLNLTPKSQDEHGCRSAFIRLLGNLAAAVLIGFFAAQVARSSDGTAGEAFAALIAAAIKEVAQGEENGPALFALMGKLPQDTDGSFIVEGDLALGRHELVDHLVNLAPGVEMTDDSPELLLATVGGVNSVYSSKADRRLTYAIDKASFGSEERYVEMVALMEEATSDWEKVCAACFIQFIHLPELDTAPELKPGMTAVNFVVRFRDAGGLFQARAFYPHDSGSDRVLDIDPRFYASAFPRAGILRHEIGHILGYRHEQIRGVPGCGAAGSDFLALTEYDNKSIMHYFCGDGGNTGMVLSDTDKDGHRLIYQLAAQ